MTRFKKIALVIALLTTGIFMTSASEAYAGGFKLRKARISYKVHHHRHRVRCCYHVYKFHCGYWKCVGKFSSYNAAKYRAHQLACHGIRFNIKKILY